MNKRIYLLLFSVILFAATPSYAEAFGNCTEFSIAAIVNNVVTTFPQPVIVLFMAVSGLLAHGL